MNEGLWSDDQVLFTHELPQEPGGLPPDDLDEAVAGLIAAAGRELFLGIEVEHPGSGCRVGESLGTTHDRSSRPLVGPKIRSPAEWTALERAASTLVDGMTMEPGVRV